MYSAVAPIDYRFMFLNAVSALANIMACRVFRGVALGTMAARDMPSGLSTTRIDAALELHPLPLNRIVKVDDT